MRSFVRCACVGLLLLLLSALTAFAQGAGTAASPAMQEANALYAAQKWDEAAKAYEKLTRENPKSGLMWFRLGNSLHALRQYERAIEAFRHSVELGNNATAMYNIARGHALLGRGEEAFDWLFRALKAGFIPAGAGLAADSELASLAGDARFREAAALAEKNARPCMFTPEHRQFDFWVGEWNVYNPQGARAGTSTIENVAGGCIVMENWTGAGGAVGKSMNFYDSGMKKWRQTWVDGRGGVLEFAGEFRDGAMRYTGETAGPNGAHSDPPDLLPPRPRPRAPALGAVLGRRQDLGHGVRRDVPEEGGGRRVAGEGRRRAVGEGAAAIPSFAPAVRLDC